MNLNTIHIHTGDNEDFIVEITKRVAVPKAAIMASSDPARALIDVVQANLRTALDKDGYSSAKDQLEFAGRSIVEDISARVNAERGSLSRDEIKKLTD